MRFFSLYIYIGITCINFGVLSDCFAQGSTASLVCQLRAIQEESSETISVFRGNSRNPILVQNAQEHNRPFIHPIAAPDENGVLTEYRPGHHTHQTGLYWGFKRLNGRDYFMGCCKPGESGYYRKISSKVLIETGPEVKWQTVYDLLDENGRIILTETQTWSMKEYKGRYLLDLQWQGDAKNDITIGEFFVGGLFLRMPWYPGIPAEVTNAAGQRNQEAESQRSMWLNIGMMVDGRDDLVHIAIFDHPENAGFPISWRVDGQFGVGPSRQIMGDWTIDKGETEVIRYRLMVYTGNFDNFDLTRSWIEYVTE